MRILVSACLLGVKCRYCGRGCADKQIIKLSERHHLIPVCPEQLGGLPTPREPAELQAGRAIAKGGSDVTEAFVRGAEEVLHLARLFDCKTAILKANSPSCGHGQIYDGSFCGKRIAGSGITARLLEENGLAVYTEETWPKMKDTELQRPI